MRPRPAALLAQYAPILTSSSWTVKLRYCVGSSVIRWSASAKRNVRSVEAFCGRSPTAAGHSTNAQRFGLIGSATTKTCGLGFRHVVFFFQAEDGIRDH